MLNFYSSLENEIQGPVKFMIKLQKLKDLNKEDRDQDLGPNSDLIYLHFSYIWSYIRNIRFK